MWVASGSFSQFRISHRLLLRGKGYEEVKCGDQAKISLNFKKSDCYEPMEILLSSIKKSPQK